MGYQNLAADLTAGDQRFLYITPERFLPNVPFSSLRKHQKSFGFPMFLGGIERKH